MIVGTSEDEMNDKIGHVTKQDRQNLLDNYRDLEPEITESINRMKPSLRSRILIIPFLGGRAFYSKYEDRVTKIKSSKLINPECLEFSNDDDPIYEYFEILL